MSRESLLMAGSDASARPGNRKPAVQLLLQAKNLTVPPVGTASAGHLYAHDFAAILTRQFSLGNRLPALAPHGSIPAVTPGGQAATVSDADKMATIEDVATAAGMSTASVS